MCELFWLSPNFCCEIFEKWAYFSRKILKNGYPFLPKSPLKMGRGFEVWAAHSCPTQIWVPIPGITWFIIIYYRHIHILFCESLTLLRARSPSNFHKSHMVSKPTSRIIKRPTNFTLQTEKFNNTLILDYWYISVGILLECYDNLSKNRKLVN